jgi:hypothetical protein
MQNSRLDCLIFAQSDNPKLVTALSLIRNKPTAGSLAVYDEFDFTKLYQSTQIFHDDTITGSKEFFREMLMPEKQVSLPDTIYKFLVKYYNDTYNQCCTQTPSIAFCLNINVRVPCLLFVSQKMSQLIFAIQTCLKIFTNCLGQFYTSGSSQSKSQKKKINKTSICHRFPLY